LKNNFLTTFSCENPNDFDSRFSKTWLFQQPAKGEKWGRTGEVTGRLHRPRTSRAKGGATFGGLREDFVREISRECAK
jgi:hypothetical protein